MRVGRLAGGVGVEVDQTDQLGLVGFAEELEPGLAHGAGADLDDAYRLSCGWIRARRPFLDGAGVALAVEEVFGVVAQQNRDGPLGSVAVGPFHTVGDHPADVFVVVDRIVLVAGGEEEDLAVAAPEGAAAAEDLAAGEGGDEDQLIGGRDVEGLAVHLLGVDDDRVGDAAGDRMGRVHRPDQFAVLLAAPAQRAGRAHQLAEDLRPVSGVQHQQSHAGEHVLVYALDHLVGDVAVRGMPPPHQHVRAGQHLLGESVLRLGQGGGGHEARRRGSRRSLRRWWCACPGGRAWRRAVPAARGRSHPRPGPGSG